MAIIDLTVPTKAHLPHLNQTYSSNFDSVYPWKDMGRWVADTTTGALKYKLHKTDSSKKTDGSAANLTGTDGDVMVKVPAYAYRVTYSPTGKPRYEVDTTVPDKYGSNIRAGFKVHPWFKNPDGSVAPYRTMGAFGGYVDANNQMRSIAGVIPTRSITQAAALDKSRQGRNTRFSIDCKYGIAAVTLLFLVEFQSLNSQDVAGRGKVDYDYQTVVDNGYAELTTGDTIALGDRTGYLEVRGETNGKTSMSYRGIEDYYGGIWRHVTGFYVTDEGYHHTGDYTKFGTIGSYTLTKANPLMGVEADAYVSGYVTGMERISALDFDFLPNAIGGAASTYYCDNFWSHRKGQTNIALFGGRWHYGSNCGVFCWHWTDVASVANVTIGARLVFRPE